MEMEMDEWMTWQSLLDKYEDYVLFKFLKTSLLQPFDKYSKEPIYCDYYHHEYYYLHSQYEKLQNIVDLDERGDAFKNRSEKLSSIVKAEPDLGKGTGKIFPEECKLSWKYLSVNSEETANGVHKRLKNAIFKKEEVDKYFDNIKSDPLKKKLRPVQKCKIDCREMAKELWEKDPTFTISAMFDHAEIKKIRNNKYMKKTFRNWVKNLCPNRKPGRRPIKSK